MKFHEGFGKFFSGIIGFLLWFYPIIGAIIGGYIGRFGVTGLGIVVGILAGVLVDIIMLGPMIVIINIQNYLEEIRDAYYSVETDTVENTEDEESEGTT